MLSRLLVQFMDRSLHWHILRHIPWLQALVYNPVHAGNSACLLDAVGLTGARKGLAKVLAGPCKSLELEVRSQGEPANLATLSGDFFRYENKLQY
jgi:hypothetical protein